MIDQTSGLFPAAGAQSPAFVQKPLSQSQSSAQPVITAGFAPLSFCVGFFGGGGVVVLVGCWLTWWETWAVMRLWSGCAGHSGPSDKSIRRIPFDWVCAALWRGLKPKLTSPFDAAAPSCSDESTRCLWNKPRGFVADPHTSWCLITSRGVSAGGHYCPDTKF